MGALETETGLRVEPRDDIRFFFEDFSAGQAIDCGDRVVTEDDVRMFGDMCGVQPDQYDAEGIAPDQPAASGWHLLMIQMELFFDVVISRSSAQGGLGIHECTWERRALAGERVGLMIRVLETRTSASRPGTGFVKLQLDLSCARGLLVSLTSTTLFGLRS